MSDKHRLNISRGRGGSGVDLSRRGFLAALGAGGSLLAIGACGYYGPEEGVAYQPWEFPDGGEGPLALVHAALLAANPHNTQPWAFQIGPDRIALYADMQRTLGAMDPLLRELRIGLGCALENLVVAAGPLGFDTQVRYADDPAELMAEVTLTPAAPSEHALFDAIAARRTSRGQYADIPLAAAELDELRAVADEPGVHLTLVTDAASRAALGEATIAATEEIVADRDMLLASDAWYRHSKADIERHRDGVTLDAQGLDGVSTAAGKVLGRPSAETGGDYWLSNTKNTHTRGGAGYALLSAPMLEDTEILLRVGRVYQRLALWLETRGVATHPLNQLPERRDRELQRGLTPVRGDYLAGLVPDGHVHMIFRFGYAWDRARHSPRRPVAWVAEEVGA